MRFSIPAETSSEDVSNAFETSSDVDEPFISLYQDAADVYAGYRDEHPGAKLHVTESLSTGLPTRWRTTDGTVDERSQLPTHRWAADALILLDLGFYSFWLFDRIDHNGGWFVTRLKSDATPEIVTELRTWRGNIILVFAWWAVAVTIGTEQHWLYAAVDPEANEFPLVQLFQARTTERTMLFLHELSQNIPINQVTVLVGVNDVYRREVHISEGGDAVGRLESCL